MSSWTAGPLCIHFWICRTLPSVFHRAGIFLDVDAVSNPSTAFEEYHPMSSPVPAWVTHYPSSPLIPKTGGILFTKYWDCLLFSLPLVWTENRTAISQSVCNSSHVIWLVPFSGVASAYAHDQAHRTVSTKEGWKGDRWLVKFLKIVFVSRTFYSLSQWHKDRLKAWFTPLPTPKPTPFLYCSEVNSHVVWGHRRHLCLR